MKLTDAIESLLKSKADDRVLFVTPDQSVYEAITQMAEEGVGALMVISENQLVGVVSERDYARKVILKGRSSKDTKVREIMTANVLCVNPNQTNEECMALMTAKRIRHLSGETALRKIRRTFHKEHYGARRQIVLDPFNGCTPRIALLARILRDNFLHGSLV